MSWGTFWTVIAQLGISGVVFFALAILIIAVVKTAKDNLGE